MNDVPALVFFLRLWVKKKLCTHVYYWNLFFCLCMCVLLLLPPRKWIKRENDVEDVNLYSETRAYFKCERTGSVFLLMVASILSYLPATTRAKCLPFALFHQFIRRFACCCFFPCLSAAPFDFFYIADGSQHLHTPTRGELETRLRSTHTTIPLASICFHYGTIKM